MVIRSRRIFYLAVSFWLAIALSAPIAQIQPTASCHSDAAARAIGAQPRLHEVAGLCGVPEHAPVPLPELRAKPKHSARVASGSVLQSPSNIRHVALAVAGERPVRCVPPAAQRTAVQRCTLLCRFIL